MFGSVQLGIVVKHWIMSSSINYILPADKLNANTYDILVFVKHNQQIVITNVEIKQFLISCFLITKVQISRWF